MNNGDFWERLLSFCLHRSALIRGMLMLVLVCAPAGGRGVCAEPASELEARPFEEAVTRSVIENPEVMAAWHQFLASREERRLGWSEYLPKLDVQTELGREESKTPLRARSDYSLGSSRVTVRQMLFDGFATQHEVERLDGLVLTRFYALRSAAEAVGLDAVQAYLDVLRREELVALAGDNYIEHRRVYRDIEERVMAGISRKVDLEQASARLSLAETNLLIETSNLHDVRARYQRVVGVLPADGLVKPELPSAWIPEDVREALRRAYAQHPRLRGAVAGVRAARADQKGRNAPLMPRIDLRMTRQLDDDADGLEGESLQSTAEVVVSYNLFNGGADLARTHVFQQRFQAAVQAREQACREVRQNLLIAHNDIASLTAQVSFLDRNQLATGKARLVYRKQFSIGQRSLLDLLDSENEYFEIRRRYVNAVYDLEIARARTLQGMGVLLRALGIKGRDELARDELEAMEEGSLVARCSLETPLPTQLERDQILLRLEEDPRLRRRRSEPDDESPSW